MQSTATQHRRATDHPRRPRATRPLPRDRFTLALAGPSDHMRGWVAYGLSLPLPAEASADYREGYAAHRDCVIDLLTAQDDIASLFDMPRAAATACAPAPAPSRVPFQWVESWIFLLGLGAALAVIAALQVGS